MSTDHGSICSPFQLARLRSGVPSGRTLAPRWPYRVDRKCIFVVAGGARHPQHLAAGPRRKGFRILGRWFFN
jgi:hypothetical protein